MMEHLLKLQDLSRKEITDILNLADQLKFEHRHGIIHNRLQGKTLGMIFSKSSTRTRVSFETGMFQLGGMALFLSTNDIQLGRGEPVKDTARVLSRFLDGIMIRTFKQSDVEELASYSTIPIINGLTDYCHPCQVLADLMTIREFKDTFKGIKMCFVGDGNNMANSLIAGAVTLDIKLNIACPKGYEPDSALVKAATESGHLTLTEDVFEAAKDCDVLYTDVWASMGQEAEAERRKKDFAGFQINSAVMSAAKPDAMVLHCLPAHRGEEITDEVLEAHAKEIFEQAENRMHAQKAVLVKLMEKPKAGYR